MSEKMEPWGTPALGVTKSGTSARNVGRRAESRNKPSKLERDLDISELVKKPLVPHIVERGLDVKETNN